MKDGETCADMGASWVGPQQKPVLALIKELGVSTYKQEEVGKNIMDVRGKLGHYTGSIPKCVGILGALPCTH